MNSTNKTTVYLGRVQIQRAFNTRGQAQKNDPGVAFEPFGSAVNQGNDGRGVQIPIVIIP